MVRFLASIVFATGFAVGCGGPKNPELSVLKVRGDRDTSAQEVVFVQVSNPAKKAMRLTRLEYTFATAGSTVSEGSVALSRDVPAGAAVVVEVPVDLVDDGPVKPMTLRGRLTAELDQIVRTFKVSAEIQPDQVVSQR